MPNEMTTVKMSALPGRAIEMLSSSHGSRRRLVQFHLHFTTRSSSWLNLTGC